MTFPKRLWAFGLLLFGFTAFAQESADPVWKAAADRFEAERKTALEQKFSEASLERAGQLAARAEAARKAGNPVGAARLLRDARWQVPFVAPDQPKFVHRVLGNTRMKHGDKVLGLALDPKGSRVASCSSDGTVRVRDLDNGRDIRTYREHTGEVKAVDWSADGKLIASASGKEIHVQDAETGKRLQTLVGHSKPVLTLAFRPDNKTLASGGDDLSLKLWDLDTGKEKATLGQQTSTIYRVRWSKDGKLLASVNNEGNLNVWNPEMPAPANKLALGTTANVGGAFDVLFGADGRYIFTCGGDRTAKMHGATGPEGQSIPGTGVKIKQFGAENGGHSDNVTAMALTTDGRYLATGSTDKSIRIWDVAAGKVIRTLSGHTAEIRSLVLSRDDNTLISGSADHTIRIWNLDPSDSNRGFEDHKAAVWSAVLSPDGRLLASAGADRTILVREVVSGKVLLKLADEAGHRLSVTAVSFSPDSSKLASASGDKLVKVWDAKTGGLLKDCVGHTAPVMALCFSADGQRILSGGIDKSVILWNAATGEVVKTVGGIDSVVSAVALSKDGKRAFAGGADGRIRLMNLGDATPLGTIVVAHQSGVGSLALSPNENRLVSSGGDKLVKLWAVTATGLNAVSELKGHTAPVSSAAFSPNDQLIASGGGDNLVRIWSSATGAEIRTLRGHADWVSSVMFTADSRSVVSASVDKSVRIWELSSEETATAVGHVRAVNAIAVSRDGRRVATGGEDRQIKIWDLDTGSESMTLTGHTQAIRGLTFDATGKILISGGDDRKLRFWDLETKRETSAIDTDRILGLALTASGEGLMAWLSREGVGDLRTTIMQVSDLKGKVLLTLTEKEKKVDTLSFSADGDFAAIGTPDGIVRVWDLKKNERVIEKGDLPVTNKQLIDIALTPDAARILSLDETGEVKVWDLKKREAVETIRAVRSNAAGLLLMADGKTFAVWSSRGEVQLWKVGGKEPVRSWELPTPVINAVFSRDGKYLMTANGDTTASALELP